MGKIRQSGKGSDIGISKRDGKQGTINMKETNRCPIQLTTLILATLLWNKEGTGGCKRKRSSYQFP